MSCTYCCTRISRGKAISYPISDIILQIEKFIEEGRKEIYLTGQDCGFYNWNSLTIVDLAHRIHDEFKHHNIFVRIGMIDPIHPSELIKLSHLLMESPIFYKFTTLSF